MFRVDSPVCEMPPLPSKVIFLVSADLKFFWDKISTLHWGLVEIHAQTRHTSEPKQEWEAALQQHVFLPDSSMNQQIKCVCCWYGIQSKLKADTPKCLSNCLSQAPTVPSEWCQVNDIGRGPHWVHCQLKSLLLIWLKWQRTKQKMKTQRCLWSCSADFL